MLSVECLLLVSSPKSKYPSLEIPEKVGRGWTDGQIKALHGILNLFVFRIILQCGLFVRKKKEGNNC